MNTPPLVISLGGSLIVPPTGIDTDFLKQFRAIMLDEIAAQRRFILVVGGGATARVYMHGARDVAALGHEDMDWLGIHATRINAHLLRTIFRDVAHPVVCKDPRRRLPWTKPILIGAGWKPGWSTDYIAVRLAKLYGAKQVINLTNVERVYDKDPALHDDAVPMDKMNWKDFRTIVGNVWAPGTNAPFDPIASRLAAHSKMRVIIAKGSNLSNLRHLLNDRPFVGTVLE